MNLERWLYVIVAGLAALAYFVLGWPLAWVIVLGLGNALFVFALANWPWWTWIGTGALLVVLVLAFAGVSALQGVADAISGISQPATPVAELDPSRCPAREGQRPISVEIVGDVVYCNYEPVPPTVPEKTPEPERTPAPPKAGCLPNARAIQILQYWMSQPGSLKNRIGAAVAELNEEFEMAATGNPDDWAGQQWGTGPYQLTQKESGYALVWTDLAYQPVTLPNGGMLVSVFVEGEWGIHLTKGDVTIPTPGRSAWLCSPVTDPNSFAIAAR